MSRVSLDHVTRRRVCRIATLTAATAVLAGCGGPEGEDDTDLPAEEGTGNGQEQEDDESNGDDGGEAHLAV